MKTRVSLKYFVNDCKYYKVGTSIYVQSEHSIQVKFI